MNDQIKKLAEQAKAYATESTKDFTGDEPVVWMDYYTEKFAKLIIKECIDKITTYDLVPGHSAKWEDIYDIHVRLLQDLGEELKEHFGVEE